MKAIEYGERHGNVGDDGPRPDAEESQMIRANPGTGFLQCVHRPQRYVDDYQEGDQLLTGLVVPRATPAPSDLGSSQNGSCQFDTIINSGKAIGFSL